jgi:hypothetical protein
LLFSSPNAQASQSGIRQMLCLLEYNCSTHVYAEMNFPGESAGKRTSSSNVSREIRHHDDTDSIGTNKSYVV